jgi:hypothetical protein
MSYREIAQCKVIPLPSRHAGSGNAARDCTDLDKNLLDASWGHHAVIGNRRHLRDKLMPGDVVLHDGELCDVLRNKRRRLYLTPRTGGPERIAHPDELGGWLEVISARGFQPSGEMLDQPRL